MTNYPILYNGARLWANPNDVEDSALQQITNSVNLPWTRGVAVMPDVHTGYGVTIGSVIAMKGAVSPSAVGVDIGCLDAETEFLSPNGWVRMDSWDGEQVLTYDPSSDTAYFDHVTAYIDKPCDEFYWFKNSKGMDQMVSEEHRLLVFTGYKSRGKRHRVMNPAHLAELGHNGYYTSKSTFHVAAQGVDIRDSMIRVEIMVQADGRVRVYDDHTHVELHFRKDRKVIRAEHLLSEAGINFSTGTGLDGSRWIRFDAPAGTCTKDLSRYWSATRDQLAVIVDEVLKWDGHEGYRSFYSSTDKASTDLVQYAFAATGVRAGISSAGKQKGHHAEVLVVTPTRNEFVSYCAPEVISTPGSRKYCFTVPTGFFVARRGGKIFTTGNCGMAAVRTTLRLEDLPDDLGPLRSAIEAAVPVGFHSYNLWSPLVDGHQVTRIAHSFDGMVNDFYGLRAPLAGRESKVKAQCGTLGGGNHFIELCADEKGEIWITLHSGSRNIGKVIADWHINRAKGLAHNQDLSDPALAAVLLGTPESRDYLHDMYWAQDYALLNRAIMLATVKQVLTHYFTPGVVEFHNTIQCHHNYVAEEIYDGQQLAIIRKGAIAAHSGELGIIPGSMGTGSYIVEGLGNELSYNSASHGAGRKMSRGKARKAFTVEDLSAQTAGIECRKDADILDEAPGAYKDIDSVMEAQRDLVRPVARLRTLLCVKG